MMGGPEPKTMTKEWQEMSNEYAKVSRAVPCRAVFSLLSRGLIMN